MKYLKVIATALALMLSMPSLGQTNAQHATEVEVLLRAYTTLATLHVPPIDNKRLAEAAVRALPRGAAAVPTFTPDAETDSRLLEQYARLVFAEPKPGDTRLWEAVKAMIDATDDPHTVLFSPEEWKAVWPFLDGLPSSVISVATVALLPEGRYVLTGVDSSSPEGKAGLKPGDVVLAMDGREASRDQQHETGTGPPVSHGIGIRVAIGRSRLTPNQLKVTHLALR